MELSAAQQERYSRHLLLDGFDQEKLLQASVAVRGKGQGAHWAARYLAASGVGRLRIDDPAWRDELLALGPWLRFVPDGEVVCEPVADDAAGGTLAAIRTLRVLLT